MNNRFRMLPNTRLLALLGLLTLLAPRLVAQDDYYERLAANRTQSKRAAPGSEHFRFFAEFQPLFGDADVESSDRRIAGNPARDFEVEDLFSIVVEAEYRFDRRHSIAARVSVGNYSDTVRSPAQGGQWAGAVIPPGAGADFDVESIRTILEYRWSPDWLNLRENLSIYLSAGLLWEFTSTEVRVPTFPLFVEDQDIEDPLPYPVFGIGGRWQLTDYLTASPVIRYGILPSVSAGEFPDGGSGKQEASYAELSLAFDLVLADFVTVGTSIGYLSHEQELSDRFRTLRVEASGFVVLTVRLGVRF